MANAPDTLVVTGPAFQQSAFDDVLVTPTGGTQGKLADKLVNSGFVAINTDQLTIAAGGTLGITTGPTIPVIASTNPLIIQGNSIAAPGGGSASTIIELNGRPGGNSNILYDAYGGAGFLSWRRTNGSASVPTAVVSNNQLGALQAAGYDGAAWPAVANMTFSAIENWTTAAHGSKIGFGVMTQGTTVQAQPLTLTGATGAKAVQVTGGLSIDQSGTFALNGATAVTVAATGVTALSSIIMTRGAPGGTPGAAPTVGTISAGVNFTVSGTALDTSTFNFAIIN